MINTRIIYTSVFAFLAFTILFILFPQLDIIVSTYFYYPTIGFLYKKNIFIQILYRSVPILTKVFTSFCVLYIITAYIRHKKLHIILQTSAFFLFFTAIISPGLVVNTILKNHFGRARPIHIKEFNGDKDFSRAFIITNQCKKNCSFSSGHAAMAFSASSIAYVIKSKYFTKIYLCSVLFGVLVGFSRIVMGGHFASDITTSGLIVLLLNHLIFIWWKKKALA